MSANTAAGETPAALVVTRAAWTGLPSAVPGMPVRPFVIGAPQAPVNESPIDLVLPSLVAQRSAAAEQQGFERGFDTGERAGLEAVRVRTEGHLLRLAATIEELRALRIGLLQQAERDLVRLAGAIAELVLRRELRADRDAMVEMARAAIGKLGDAHVATILLNPADLEAMKGPVDEPSIRLAKDPSLPAGSCIVQSALGTIDVSIDAQIREILTSLLGDHPDAGDSSQEGSGTDVRR